MGKTVFSSYRISERSYISLVKRDIHRLAIESGFSQQKTGEIDIIVSEITSNLIKHTNDGGSLLFKATVNDNGGYFELFCFDDGPGTNEIQRMIKDGMSSSNTLGQGLGAISRLSDQFQIYSLKDWGTVVYSKKFIQDRYYRPKEEKLNIKVLQEPIAGELVCGDGFAFRYTDNEIRMFLGDGLGHGEFAFDAVQAAITSFKNCDECDPVEILKQMHLDVKRTRGLVGTVVIMDHHDKKWRMAGVGNISTRIYSGIEYKNYMPHNGIIGLNLPNSIKCYEMDLERYQTIVMSTDGIKTRWDLGIYPSILKYDPSIIAAAIFKDHARKTDDMTIVVGKTNF